ncbi:delta-60 repeat domain [Pseudomonas fluorescens]|uniref:Delta-60 repeat domain n=1 Tax=Pseudomonas fluorescens TaxID=294 RepID=A0A379IHL9_PSEFL|nr:hypothetical protein [Pseudomonas fluorescens]AIG02488.1 hypothetical protein HZ99_10130 [Pseudomonas fluorescens]SUD32887.1 delta-60 repeat domain [Pseudomonas fluorescens]
MSIPSNSNTVNAAGGPDLSFGNTTPKDGSVITTESGGLSRALSDGSFITAGVAYIESKRFIAVTKHNPTGELDTNFGVWYTPTTDFVTLVNLIIQPDGKPLLLAALGNEQTAFITRFNSNNGQVDLSFGVNGTTVLDNSLYTVLIPRGGLAVQADNAIICVFHDNTDSFIYQLSSSGELTNFGNTEPIKAPNTQLNTMLVTNSGFVIAGSAARKAHIIGLLHDGQLDSSFGNNGIVELQFSNNNDKQVTALAKGQNGQIVVVGGTYTLPPQVNFVASLLANGQPNSQFHQGKPLESSTQHGSYTSVAVQPDRKIVVLARLGVGNLIQLIRHTLAGQLDPTFGTGGVAEAWRDPQGRPLPSGINFVEWVEPSKTLQSSGILSTTTASFIGRLLSQ